MATSHSGTPPSLPPSVEEAYRRKCIDLRRRQHEVEAENDQARLRKMRLVRGVRKMRLERAILLDVLARRMRKGGADDAPLSLYDDESEDSSDSPPTPQERPFRSKKGFRRAAASPPPAAPAQADANPISSGPPSFISDQPATALAPGAVPVPLAPIPHEASQSSSTNAPRSGGSNIPAAQPRPPLPGELYAEEFVTRALEPGAAPSADDVDAAVARFSQLSPEEQAPYRTMYEERMEEWTRSEDRRKKALHAERRAARLGRTGGMENGADEAAEGSEGGSQPTHGV